MQTKITNLTALNVRALNEIIEAGVKGTGERGCLPVPLDSAWVDGKLTKRTVLVDVPTPTILVCAEVTATTATFPGTALEAAQALGAIIERIPTRGHPRASLHAVVRKLAAVHAAGKVA